MDLNVAAVCFPIIFLGELPDKTMFASLLMATRARPFPVWLGAAAAFAIHVAIATTVGVALFALAPKRVVDGVVAALFLFGAGYAWRESADDEEDLVAREASTHGTIATAFIVIFIAEWGDLTQILTANLAARYHDPLSVGTGAVLALWCVGGIAALSGKTLLRFVNVATVRRITAGALLVLSAYTGYQAFA